MGSWYDNPGKVDVERAVKGIVDAGGGVNVQQKDGYVHKVAYSTTENRHFSYDEYPDGTIKNVHTDKDNHGYTTYGGGR